ncbi:MAG: hypothetical protein AB1430_05700 [Pseudomonadota bacterium]
MNLYQDVFFRALDMARGRHTIERLHFLRKSQHWDRQTLQRWQLQRLNALLQQARDHSPYYAQALASATLPLRSLDELRDLPVLDKGVLRKHFDALQCRNIARSRFVLSRTGGSTGEPTYYYWDKRGQDWNRASVYRSAEWAGVALGERTAQMSGSHFDYTESQKLKNRLVYFLQRYRDWPVSAVTDALMEHYFAELHRFRPTSIWGYASGLNAFAAYIERRHPGARLDFVKALITSSETLQPEQRERIDRVFGAGKVHDNYGSREIYYGAECEAHDGYHLHAEVIILEVVRPDGSPCQPGERGRILVTDLSNHAFPFIRYENGDVGVMAPDVPCRCGVQLPRLQSIEGRIADLVVLRDRVLTAPNFATLFSDLRGVDAYQIRQDTLDRVDVYIVPGAQYSPQVRQYLQGAMQQLVGGAQAVIHEVARIEVPESGKRRYVVSSVSERHLRQPQPAEAAQ